MPPNVQFEVDDIEQDWTYKSPFDFIHARFLASSIRDWPRLFQQVFKLVHQTELLCVKCSNFLARNLKPGGYTEFFDWDFRYQSDDGSLKETHEMHINIKEVLRAADIIGQTATPGPHLKKWAEDAGFVNIKEHVFKVPYGSWPKDPKLVNCT